MECYNLPIAPRPRSSKDAAPRLRKSAAFAWENRWWSMISVATQNALAATLVDDAPHMLHAWKSSTPPLGILLHGEAPAEKWPPPPLIQRELGSERLRPSDDDVV